MRDTLSRHFYTRGLGKYPFSRLLACCLILVIFSHTRIVGQDQALSDSLEQVFLEGDFAGDEELQILKTLAEELSDTEKKLGYSNKLIERARSMDSIGYVFSGILQKGNTYRLKGDLSLALEQYFEAASIANDLEMNRDVGLVNVAIADVYSIMGNHERSVAYYRGAIDILQSENDSVNLASALLNVGDEYFNHGDLDTALVLFQASSDIFKAISYETGVAYNLGNIGLVYAQMGDNLQAEENITRAVEILEAKGDFYPIAVYLTFMSDIYFAKGDEPKAMYFAERSLELARNYGLKEQISDASLKLSQLFEQTGNSGKALDYYKQHVAFKDSVSNIASVQQMAELRTDYEVSQKQLEVDLLNEQKRNQTLISIFIGIALLLIASLALVLFRRNRFIRETNAIIAEERDRSDRLLLNILPEETAQELKESGKVKAKKFDSVTVLFTDFKAFTSVAETLTPEKLVESVDYYFSRFDQIIEKYGLEKIKTIGDAYMAAGGLPFQTDDHAYKMIRAALEMRDFVEKTRSEAPNGLAHFRIRIGINTGPIVAGIVGIRKFAYDIWGDTVNIASRMETSSDTGMINVSENTYQLVRDKFDFLYRGEIQVKNKGMMKMYYVESVKDESAVKIANRDVLQKES